MQRRAAGLGVAILLACGPSIDVSDDDADETSSSTASSTFSSGGDVTSTGASTVGPSTSVGTVTSGTTAVGGSSTGRCVSDRDFFEAEVLRAVIQAQCFACHNPRGVAPDPPFVFVGDDDPDFVEINYDAFAESAVLLQLEGEPLILLEATNVVPHGGGKKVEEGDATYQVLEEMIDRVLDPFDC